MWRERRDVRERGTTWRAGRRVTEMRARGGMSGVGKSGREGSVGRDAVGRTEGRREGDGKTSSCGRKSEMDVNERERDHPRAVVNSSVAQAEYGTEKRDMAERGIAGTQEIDK